MKAIRKDMRDNKGFTLVELIVVIVILAVLIGVSVSGYSKYIGQSKMNTDKNNAETVRAAIINAQAADGVYEAILPDSYLGFTITIENTGCKLDTDAITSTTTSTDPAVTAVLKAVDLATLKTQTTGGIVTLTATPTKIGGAGADKDKHDGSLTVEITANDKYPDTLFTIK